MILAVYIIFMSSHTMSSFITKDIPVVFSPFYKLKKKRKKENYDKSHLMRYFRRTTCDLSPVVGIVSVVRTPGERKSPYSWSKSNNLLTNLNKYIFDRSTHCSFTSSRFYSGKHCGNSIWRLVRIFFLPIIRA